MPGKKNQKTNSIVNNKVETPVVAKVETPVVEAKVEKKQGGGRKKPVAATPAVVSAPVVEAVSVEPTSVESKQKGGRKKVATPVVAPVDVVETKTPAKKQQRKKKDLTNNAQGDDAESSQKTADVQATVDEVAVLGEKQIRSFKVLLPGSSDFEGRFTGLTPYQAANKALSKYFREGERTDGEVTFSICESTRKSKKTVYTYVGQRHKLAEPVKYTIQDGREIVKNFKNTLKKVKKTESSNTEVQTQPVSASL